MRYDHLAAGLKEALQNDESAFDADRLQKYTDTGQIIAVGCMCSNLLIAKTMRPIVLGVILCASHSRTFSLINGYSAPLETYKHLEHYDDAMKGCSSAVLYGPGAVTSEIQVILYSAPLAEEECIWLIQTTKENVWTKTPAV